MDFELLLAEANGRRPVLERGLPLYTASRQPRPEETASPEHLFDMGGDPSSLPQQRWGVVAPEGALGDRLLSLIEPLRQARQEAQGAKVRVYRAPPALDAAQAARWKDTYLRDESVPEAEQPRYLLLLGDLDQLSLELQQVLASDGFAGRLAFPADAGYQAYVEKVLRWERAPAPAAQARALFFTAHDGTAATTIGYRSLVAPSLQHCRERQEAGDFPTEQILEVGAPADWRADRLLAQAAVPLPSLLFSVSHGQGAPREGWGSVEEQRRRQGAMCLGTDPPLEADALARTPFLPGGIWFFLACFGAGTPARSAYHTWLSKLREAKQFSGRLDRLLAALPREGERPFIAALPQAVLANPEGPLAVVGHVDLAWTYSFQDVGRRAARSRPSRFMGLLRSLVAGRRAGVGLGALLRFFNEANVELTSLYEQEETARLAGRDSPVDVARRAHLWMLRQDVASYILLGDPAVRLPLALQERADAGRPAGEGQAEAALLGLPVAREEAPSAEVMAEKVLALFGGEESPKPVAREETPSDKAMAERVLALLRGEESPKPVAREQAPSAKAMAEAVLALLAGEESPKAIAARAGVPLQEARRWEQVYREAGLAALERLRAPGPVCSSRHDTSILPE